MAGLRPLDAIAPVAYLAAIAYIGLRSKLRRPAREEFLLGGRRFGRVLQSFAWFSQASAPDAQVGVATTTFHNGVAGVWTSLIGVFFTPILWLAAPWMRRLRLLTMADFYAERYGSRTMAAVYAAIATLGTMTVLAAADVAVAKSTIAMTGVAWSAVAVVWLVAGFTLLNVLIGGLAAAFHATVIQGLVVIVTSVLLPPIGFAALAHGPSLRERLPSDFFRVFGSPRLPDFTWYYVAMLALVAGMTVVTQPQFMVTNAAARSESAARFGVITGTLGKRVCTILWGVVGLIAVALFSSSVQDPDTIWGHAARELLAPLNAGLLGLMLVGMIASLSAVSNSLMLTASGLLTQNLYRVVRPGESEGHYVLVARLAGIGFVGGAAVIASQFGSLFALLKLNWEFFVVFAGAFWLGLKWRRANRAGAWASILVTFIALYGAPVALTVLCPSLRTTPPWLEVAADGRSSIFWSQGIGTDDMGRAVGRGYPYLDLLAMRAAGVDLTRNCNAVNETLRLGLRLALPFFVLVLVSHGTAPDDPALLERFYSRMRHRAVEPSAPGRDDSRQENTRVDRLLSRSRFELYRWSRSDLIGLLLTLLFTAAIVGLLYGTVALLR